jgi:Uma2 family endonuclease
MTVVSLVKIPAHLHVTDKQFLQLIKANPDLRLERTAEGALCVMPPTGSEGRSYNAQVEIYRPAQPVEVLQAPAMLTGEEVLPGFVLNLQILGL